MRIHVKAYIPIPEGVRGKRKFNTMQLLKLLDGQNVYICDHRRGNHPHDINDSTAHVHLDKGPNFGKNFQAKIRIPLNQPVTVEVLEQVNRNLSSREIKEIRKKLEREVREVFQERENCANEKGNFVRTMVDLLEKNWQDKLSSIERAKDVARHIGSAFGIGDEVENIIRQNERGELLQYTSLTTHEGKSYFTSVTQDNIHIGELSGRMKTKYSKH